MTFLHAYAAAVAASRRAVRGGAPAPAPAPAPSVAPAFTAAPVIVGIPTEGSAAAAVDGTATGTPTPTVTPTWVLDGTPIGTSFTPATGDVGKSLVRRNTAANGVGSPAVSNSSPAVIAAVGSLISILSNPVTTALNATGSGTRYDITDDTSFDAVPFGALVPGDVVNLFWKATPYLRKPAFRSRGTITNKIIFNGVTDASGNRPQINFNGAQTALGCNPGLIGGSASLNIFNTASAFSLEDFGGIIIRDAASGDSGVTKPSWLVIKNIDLFSAKGSATFLALPATPGGSRVTKSYIDAASGIRVQRGADIEVANCLIHDCPWGFYSHISSGLIADICERMTLRNNRFWDGGRVGAGTEHNCYIQCINPIVEGNWFGPLIAGADGAAYKSRCAGEINRYNTYDTHARAVDLVEVEEQIEGTAAAVDVADYGVDHFFGNTVIYDDTYTVDPIHPFHIGGDKSGQQEMLTTGVPPPGAPFIGPIVNGKMLYRRELYFYSNTYVCRGKMPIRFFDINEEAINVYAWNNILVGDANGSGAYAAGRFALLERAGTLRLLGGNIIHAAAGSTIDDFVTDGWFSNYTDVTFSNVIRTVAPASASPQFVAIGSQNYQVGAGSPARSAAVATPSGLPAGFKALPVQYQGRGRTNGLVVRPTVTTAGAFEYGVA